MKFLKWLGAFVAVLLLIIAGFYIYLQITYYQPQQKKAEVENARLDIAKEMFAERCKGAGVTIHRTVEDVEGIFLMKFRPTETNFGDQFRMDDPYGSDVGGEGYLLNFLSGKSKKGSINHTNSVTNGYHYVEAIDQADGKRYRYTG
jgi:hypothetical protein